MCKITDSFKREVAFRVLLAGVCSILRRSGVSILDCGVNGVAFARFYEDSFSGADLHRICRLVYGFGAKPSFSSRHGVLTVSVSIAK